MPALGLDAALRVTLPLGISFYTFQSMSYAIDVYRGHAKPIRSFIDFACFVSMFPQLVAGPIVRFSEVADQLRSRTHTATKFARGIAFLSLGLAKKVLLANPCGKVADLAFDAGSLGPLEAWYGVVAYAFQIYFDFSGYSDMAVGLGLMFGFVFAKNFDSPYRAQSITEFWHRWHISLSTWLRDYLYLPLGGNRKGTTWTYINLFVVMVLGGVWHGAAWNFVIWGALHGVFLAGERLRGKTALYGVPPPPLRVAMTFTIVLMTWVSSARVISRMPFVISATCSRWGTPQDGACLAERHRLSTVLPGNILLAGDDCLGRAADVGVDAILTPVKATAVVASAGAVGSWCSRRRHSIRSSISFSDGDVHPLPAGGATREEIAQIEVGQTTVSPATAARAGGAFPDGYLRGADRRVVRHAIGTRTREADGLGPPDECPRRDPLAACPRRGRGWGVAGNGSRIAPSSAG